MNRIENQRYQVVVNHEEQYSLWPQGKENALGWRNAGLIGTKEQCLAFIREMWTDMRPLSLRRSMTLHGGDTAKPANYR